MKRFTRIREFSKLSSEENEISSQAVFLNNKTNYDRYALLLSKNAKCSQVGCIFCIQSETVHIKRKTTMITSVIKRAKRFIYAYLGNKRFSITKNIRSSMLLFRV